MLIRMNPSPHRWSPLEDQFMRDMWPRLSVDDLALELERTPIAVYNRLLQLGITGDVPGYVTLSRAAEITGFDRQTTERIIEWAHVPVYIIRTPQGGPDSRGVWAIDEHQLREAAALWMGHETVRGAAERRGLQTQVLQRILRAAGVLPPPQPGGRGAFRVPTDVIDTTLARHRRAVARATRTSAR